MFFTNNIFHKVRFLVITSILFASCIKDKISLPDQSLSKYVNVYMPQAAKAPLNYTFNTNDSISDYMIFGGYLSGLDAADNDISLSFEVGPNLIDSFNLANNTDYLLLPSSIYSIGNLTSSIKKGNVSTDPLKITILNASNSAIDNSKTYLLPIYIQSASVEINSKLSKSFFIVHFTN